MKEFTISFLTSSAVIVLAIFLLRNWLIARITNSIKSEYDHQLEIFKRQLDKKQKIELISELLAEWIKYPIGEPIPREQRTKLNKLSFQLTLWLPKGLAEEMNKTLQHQENAKTIFDILLLARKELFEEDALTAEFITFWSYELEQKSELVLTH